MSEPRARTRRRKIIIGALIALAIILLLGGGILTIRSARAAVSQPVPYSHQVHIEAGAECLFCHPNATKSPIAGVPSVQKCMSCHEVIATENHGVQILTGYWERGEPIPWERVVKQPDFVYFSHQPHVNSGLACENCHGEVSQMETVEQVVDTDMGWCLECHELQGDEDFPRLRDCLLCHK
jgi:c(7)-type cytochrome triheme protein